METTKDRKITAFRLRTSLLERLKLDAKRDAHSPAVGGRRMQKKTRASGYWQEQNYFHSFMQDIPENPAIFAARNE